MAEQRTFEGVTAEMWARLCEIGQAEHGTVYTGEGTDRGVATTRTVIGEIVLAYVHDPAANTITYTIERKPMLVAAAQIWSGIERAIGTCRPQA